MYIKIIVPITNQQDNIKFYNIDPTSQEFQIEMSSTCASQSTS